MAVAGAPRPSEPGHQRRQIDTDPPQPELTLSPEQVCFIIVKAREFDEKVPPVQEQQGSNPADDPRLALEDLVDDPTYQELSSFIEALSDDGQNELVAMMWLGRGDYTVDAWSQALGDAAAMRDRHVPTYLIGTALLGDYLEEGFSQLGRSCLDEERGRL